jgi:hypothetical protein
MIGVVFPSNPRKSQEDPASRCRREPETFGTVSLNLSEICPKLTLLPVEMIDSTEPREARGTLIMMLTIAIRIEIGVEGQNWRKSSERPRYSHFG